MKIEFECPQCRSMLRLDAVHAGHQALCPVCGNAVIVPLEGNSPVQPRSDSGWQPMGPEGRDIEFRDGQTAGPAAPFGDSPVRRSGPATQQSPWTPPTQPPSQAWSPNDRHHGNVKDGLWTMGLICGILSLVSYVVLCWCASPIGPLIAVMGMIATMFSRQGNKAPLVILNAIGLLIGLMMLGGFLVFALAN